MSEWSVYIIQASNGNLYTGITKDVERRFNEHKDGVKGAKFFRSATPEKIVFRKEGLTHSEALKEELRIKKLKREQKMELIK